MLAFIKKLLNLDNYTSELDRFLSKLRTQYPQLSASQQHEKRKYGRVFRLRDNAQSAETPSKLWDKF